MSEEKKNSPVFLRPRFTIEINQNEKDVLKKLKKQLSNSEDQFKSAIRDSHIFIDICDKDNHFWSPQLHLEILPLGEHSSLIKGLFGPKPQVWTFFMFLHFVVGIGFLCFATMLYVNYSLDKSLMLPLLMTIGFPILWLLLYLIGRLGRDLGKKQIERLHDFLLKAID